MMDEYAYLDYEGLSHHDSDENHPVKIIRWDMIADES